MSWSLLNKQIQATHLCDIPDESLCCCGETCTHKTNNICCCLTWLSDNNTVSLLIPSNWPTSSCSQPQPYQHSPGGGGRGQLPRIPPGADARGGAGDFTRNWSSDCPWDDVREWGNVTWINVLICRRDDDVINSMSYFSPPLSLKTP